MSIKLHQGRNLIYINSFGASDPPPILTIQVSDSRWDPNGSQEIHFGTQNLNFPGINIPNKKSN